MDQTLSSGSSSKIPVYLDKTGEISEARSNCLTKEEFGVLQKHIEKTIRKIGKEMTSGNIMPKPYYQLKDKKTPCKFCPYHSICQVDYGQGQIGYQYIMNQKKENILERMKEERLIQ